MEQCLPFREYCYVYDSMDNASRKRCMSCITLHLCNNLKVPWAFATILRIFHRPQGLRCLQWKKLPLKDGWGGIEYWWVASRLIFSFPVSVEMETSILQLWFLSACKGKNNTGNSYFYVGHAIDFVLTVTWTRSSNDQAVCHLLIAIKRHFWLTCAVINYANQLYKRM